MSINVNVTGNPVRINRGKMVTANPDYAKEEFQKRRRIRMEQVRQQSKDIAESVRNKVRNEQNKQLSDMEKRGQKELKKWQARKLLQLQQQYDECLRDIGLGHSEAVEEEETDYAKESRKESYDQTAKERGYRAAEKLQQQKQQENFNKEVGVQKRNYNQAIENTRAKLIANLNKNRKNKTPFKKKKRKVSTDINISRLSGGSDTGSDVPELLNICSHSCSSSSPRETVKKSTRKAPTPISTESTDEIERQRYINKSYEKVYERGSSPTRSQIDQRGKRPSRNYYIDTRISDRIKSRTILSDSCDRYTDIDDEPSPADVREAVVIHSQQPSPRKGSPTQLPPPESPKKKTGTCLDEGSSCMAKCNRSKGQYLRNDLDEIPKRPTITIHTEPENSYQFKSFDQSTGNLNKVQYYDHKYRFTKKIIPDTTNVQRIPEESLEVCPSSRSEAEFQEQMCKRDQQAQFRGQKALQKEKVHRDYREMMQQLPGLEKQERVASIPSKQPSHHMSEDRLKHREKKKQNQMENAYEKLFPKTRVITIPPKNHAKPSTSINVLPFKTIDINDKQPSVNVGSWDVDAKPKSPSKISPKYEKSNIMGGSTRSVIGDISNPQKEATERKENLQDMLKSLQFHRDKLVKELSALPESDNRQKLFGELGHIDKLIVLGQNVDKESQSSSGTRRSRSRTKHHSSKDLNKANVSNSSGSPSRLETVREEPEKRTDGRKISRYHTRCTSGSSSSPSPPPKIINKGKRKATRPSLVLQNTSTQTTPKGKTSKEQDKPTVTGSSCTKETGPCSCCLHAGTDKSDLCEIVIKITEDGKPEITIDPAKLKDKQISPKANKEKVPADRSTSPSENQQSSKVGKTKPKSPKKQKVIVDKPKVIKQQEKQKVPDSREKKVSESREKKVSESREKKVSESREQKVSESREKSIPDSREKKTESEDFKQKSCSSWREYLSQNSTASTSYMSPPDFTSTQAARTDSANLPRHITPEAPKQKPGGHLMNMLRDKPQQINLQDSSGRLSGFIEPYLLCFVKKLLTMSRKSIDDLTVSSVSDMSTPGSSIINIQSNISTQQLDDFMKYFNINMSELQNYLNCSPDGSNIHYNTAASLSLSPTIDRSRSPNCTNVCGTEMEDSRYNNYANQAYPGVLAAYNKLAENCAKKIENLAAMIEKVRLEKINMLQSPGSGSDKENSTKYLDLPPELRKDKSGSLSPNSVLEQEELDRKLLEIDYSFAERLKNMTKEELKAYDRLHGIGGDSSSPESDQHRDSIDKELMERYKNLRGSGTKTVLDENSNCPCPCSTMSTEKTSFVPLLRDIPRLPKFEAPAATTGLHRNSCNSKPPPSKGISAAKRFSNDVNMVPHELSAIAESESLLSTRLQKSKATESMDCGCGSPELKNLRSSPSTSRPQSIVRLTAEPFSPQTSSSNSLNSVPDIIAELMRSLSDEAEKTSYRSCGKSPTKNKSESSKSKLPPCLVDPQSESSSDLENMETMLKSLGMSWAITTLRKTQEALALTSSSSSVDISVTRKEMKVSDTSSPSEFSLKEKQLLAKLSSPTDSSGGSYNFLKDLSAIYGAEICQEKSTQRTSTPVQSSRSGDKSKSDTQRQAALPGESEIWFIKDNADLACDCVPFYSLNESSIKSKSSSKND